jgi:hypothetical protein
MHDAPPPNHEDRSARARRWCDMLAAAFERARAAGELAESSGWSLADASPQAVMGGTWPVLHFSRGPAHNVCFLVMPSDAAGPAYRRTARLSLSYFSPDVPNAAQDRVYARDRAWIEAFIGWIARIDPELPLDAAPGG